MSPRSGRGHRRGGVTPASPLGLVRKDRVMLVIRVQNIAIHKKAIGVIEAAQWRGEVKVRSVVHVPDTMEL